MLLEGFWDFLFTFFKTTDLNIFKVSNPDRIYKIFSWLWLNVLRVLFALIGNP